MKRDGVSRGVALRTQVPWYSSITGIIGVIAHTPDRLSKLDNSTQENNVNAERVALGRPRP